MDFSRNATKPKLRIVVFDRYTCERADGERASPLIAIHQGLEQRGGFNVMCFDPSAFDPDNGEVPCLPLKNEKQPPQIFEPNAIFTYGFNFFDVQEHYADNRHKADIITVDYGFLKRDAGYRYVLKNGKLPVTNSNTRFKQLGLAIEDTRKPDGHILIACQDHHKEWYAKATALVYEYAKAGREIRIRRPNDDRPLDEDIMGAYGLVTYNSTCLYQALLGRVPVFCYDECVAAEVAETDLSKMESVELPSIQKVQHFLNRLAYAQWRIDELRTGIWIPHYFEGY